ncbi:structural maintenance of chromosomes protein 2-like [Tigriopus californicus]|uniref:structural maintenance of chromosomes protein 2-like n=1 Tax=Tigriopus californicus TaxID=6832 RepID=UPI0027D9E283|nr:structural maintenance of chromosomes protein 2-like [Tigriopus californicus]
MYIKSIVIDGFKSYGQRTEIHGFDPAFNAITGLNGSGKSNILDSICFLLGITNLSHVRAANLQELVYKNGQAGVTKATVTIHFDNRDKKQSPLGYDHYDEVAITRQVVIGGKNKYLINGTNIQANRVQDFFRSVQLNVNNPHFLIMQGRITKVLNMKPPEILAMIEEAAGTMMYESKKQQAQKTIEKKDSKLREITDILNEEITPTLTKLKEERSTYLEYQKIQRELEHLTKLYIAFKFVTAEETSMKSKEDLEVVNQDIETLKTEIKDGENQIVSIGQRIEQLQRQRDEELKGRFAELEKELSEHEKTAMKTENALKTVKDNKKQEDKKKTTITKGMNSDKKALDEKSQVAVGLQAMYDKLREEDRVATEALKAAQSRYEAISVGKFSSEDGKAATLQEQVIKIKADLSNAQTTIKTSDMKLKHNKKELRKMETDMKKTESDYKRDSENLKKYENQLSSAQNELNTLDYEEGMAEQLEEQHRNLRHEVMGLERRSDQMSSRYPWLNFQYDDPEKNFDRSQVYGVAAKLISVRDPKFFVALDTAGGGKLTNVIVKTSVAAGKILKRGNLRRRTVMLPLDKMNARCITTQELQSAQRLVGKDHVWRAIDLVKYDRALQAAMEHILGGVLVCTSLDVANKLAFDRSVGKMCVTLDGDKVNPAGELSGGAPSSSGSMLTHIDALREVEAELEARREQLHGLEERLRGIGPLGKRFNQLKLQVEERSHELERVRDRVKNTAHHQLFEEMEALKKQCLELEEAVQASREVEVDGSKKVKELEYKIKNAKQLKEKELKEAEVEVKACKKAVETSKSKWTDKEAEEASLKMEINDLQKAISDAEDQLRACDEAIAGYETECTHLVEAVETAKEAVLEAKEALKAQKEAVAKNNKEMLNEQANSENIAKINHDKGLKVQELKHKLSKAADEVRDAEKLVQHMLDKYEWIGLDRKFFGESGSAYDFKATDPQEAGKKIQKLEETKEKLERTVNMRAMTMLDKAEVQYNDLMRKKATVEMDKAKINKVIEELDRKKKDELRAAWDKVNKDFGSIFSSLLPGTKAKLQPPEGMDVLDGLEVKVAFGDVWKESLSELSGGQRSLVALSLILSLLLFKPAPLYILDEVDAALDLSHTQNIGHMLKTHFKHSQFIVVSLKDGMFNNANVLFRTKFVDGMSTVSRTQNKK